VESIAEGGAEFSITLPRVERTSTMLSGVTRS